MQELLANRLFQAALAGVLAAAAVDLQAFRSFKSLSEFASYSWSTAIFRWGQGAIVGALTALGLGGAA